MMPSSSNGLSYKNVHFLFLSLLYKHTVGIHFDISKRFEQLTAKFDSSFSSSQNLVFLTILK